MSDLQITYRVVPVKGGYLLKAASPLHTVVAISKDPNDKPRYDDDGQLFQYYRHVDINVPGKPILLSSMKCCTNQSEPWLGWWSGTNYHEFLCGNHKSFKAMLSFGEKAGAKDSWLNGWIIVTDFVTNRTHEQLSHQAFQKYAGKSIQFDPGIYFHYAYS